MARHHDRLTRDAKRKRRKPRVNLVARIHQLEVMTYEQNASLGRLLRREVHLARSEARGEAPDTEKSPETLQEEVQAAEAAFQDFGQASEEFRAYLTAVRSELEGH